MTNFSPHLSSWSRFTVSALLLAGAVLAALAGCAVQPVLAASTHGYGWPVAPFNRQHPIRGGFGDPRTIFFAPPTRDGVYHGGGSFSFHEGVDISAADGTPVYPVVDGVVSSVNPVRVVVDSGGGNHFEYWHIAPSVHDGERVTTDRTVLGHILRGAMHVHLTEVDAGQITDPLLPGHLTPYRDTTKPTVEAIDFRKSDEGTPLMANFLRGRVRVYAEAYDTPTLPIGGEWDDMPMTPAVITWRVETWNGRTVKIPETTAWDTRVTIPSNDAFWHYYARGTYQNMSVFGAHFSWAEPGCFIFRLGTLDTTRLADNVYRLVVTAEDVRGNRSSTSTRFSVHNKPGWKGV
jgi:Peptidase family M23